MSRGMHAVMMSESTVVIFYPGPCSDKLYKETSAIKVFQAVAPDSAALVLLVKSFQEEKLFHIATSSPSMWDIVTRTLRKQAVIYPSTSVTTHGVTGIARFSAEVTTAILHFMTVVQLVALGQTCKHFHALANATINAGMDEFFRVRDLAWDEIRFTLTHTESLISGLAANHVLFLHQSRRATVDVMKIDFFVEERYARCFVKYLNAATQYIKSTCTHDPSTHIARTVEFVHKRPNEYPFVIAMHICVGEKPKATIFRQGHTALFVGVSGRGAFIANAKHTLDGLSFGNPAYLELAKKEDLKKFDKLKATMAQHGIKFAQFHELEEGEEEIVCGQDVRCPSTVRFAEDRDFCSITFRDRSWGYEGMHMPSELGMTSDGSLSSYEEDLAKHDDVWAARYECKLRSS
ncbi:hypothetical protein DFH06DRAFT_1352147 [Mycena polygramma]|nr:hypothetical protein DFH06DRAFT_1352147 [Mycena polygramma]